MGGRSSSSRGFPAPARVASDAEVSVQTPSFGSAERTVHRWRARGSSSLAKGGTVAGKAQGRGEGVPLGVRFSEEAVIS